MYKDYSRRFYNKESADKFAASLISQGITDIVISSWRGAFGQTEYKVSWNED